MTKKTEVAVTTRDNATALVKRSDILERAVTPVADIYETVEAYVVMLDMPGASKESISITLEQGSLNITGSLVPHHIAGARMLVRELSNAPYHRVFNLGEGIDRRNADARFEDGVLTVKLYKKEEAKPREIHIQ
jgi:HSP20 family protein